jgi:hypothetical protein
VSVDAVALGGVRARGAAAVAADLVAGVQALAALADWQRRRGGVDSSKERTPAMTVDIEYWVPCGHLDRAIDTQRAILEASVGGWTAATSLSPSAPAAFGGRTWRAD